MMDALVDTGAFNCSTSVLYSVWIPPESGV